MIEMRNIGFLGRVPKRILIRIYGNFLANDESCEVGSNFGDDLDFGRDTQSLPVAFDGFCVREIYGKSGENNFIGLFAYFGQELFCPP